MPLTASGQKVLNSMENEYGDKKGKEVFYASMNANKKGSDKWHKKTGSYDKETVKKAMEKVKDHE